MLYTRTFTEPNRLQSYPNTYRHISNDSDQSTGQPTLSYAEIIVVAGGICIVDLDGQLHVFTYAAQRAR